MEIEELIPGWKDIVEYPKANYIEAAIKKGLIPDFEYVEGHREMSGYEGRVEGPIIKRLSDGKFFFINWEYDSYDSYPEYAEVSEVRKVMVEIWQ